MSHPATAQTSWALAARATGHCLLGCAIGEVLGMVLGTAFDWHAGVSVGVSTALAFVFGYALTLLPLVRSGVPIRSALPLALASDTISIAIMEVVDNVVMLVVPGAMNAALDRPLFWTSLAGSLLLAGLAALPVNRWLIARGRGHAVVHDVHGAAGHGSHARHGSGPADGPPHEPA